MNQAMLNHSKPNHSRPNYSKSKYSKPNYCHFERSEKSLLGFDFFLEAVA
jgi:hypothetical protein